MEGENFFEKIQDMLGRFNGEYNIIDKQIDVNLQIEYFDQAHKIRKDQDSEAVMEHIEMLYSDEYSIDQKKELLAQLAGVDKVEAFRAIERYMQEPMPELSDWGTLAMQESRMMMEGSLLEQNQIFISTGMGGRGNSLRYFIVYLMKDNELINDFRKNICQSEISYTFKQYKAEVESYHFYDKLLTINALIPISTNIQDVLEESVNNINQFGDFVMRNYIITNVKELSLDEIEDILSNKHEEIDEEEDDEIDLTDEDLD